jgi:hypothetical protein
MIVQDFFSRRETPSQDMGSERHPIRDHETMQIELLRRRQTPLGIEDIEDIIDDSDSDHDSGDAHVPQDLVQDSDDDDDVVDNVSGVAVIDADAVADAVADTDAAWISKYTLDPAGTVDDTRKKSTVWEFYGHLCPLTHPKLKHEKVCRKAVNALSNAKLATEKQSQTSMTSFAPDNNAIKRDYKKLCAKWIIATHQPLYACDSK